MYIIADLTSIICILYAAHTPASKVHRCAIFFCVSFWIPWDSWVFVCGPWKRHGLVASFRRTCLAIRTYYSMFLFSLSFAFFFFWCFRFRRQPNKKQIVPESFSAFMAMRSIFSDFNLTAVMSGLFLILPLEQNLPRVSRVHGHAEDIFTRL